MSAKLLLHEEVSVPEAILRVLEEADLYSSVQRASRILTNSATPYQEIR